MLVDQELRKEILFLVFFMLILSVTHTGTYFEIRMNPLCCYGYNRRILHEKKLFTLFETCRHN